jgi:RNA polymerase sigma-70 factor (ECF subfamily)
MANPDDPGFDAARFPTTHWSRVARAGDLAGEEAQTALAELCGAYWYPVYAFIRRKGNDPDAALDLTQAYFARLIEGTTLPSADPDKGRFRNFLRTDCSYFLADLRDRDRALKRGGGRTFISIDARDAEGRFLAEPAHEQTAERLFERDWALALIARTFDRLEVHYGSTGRSEIFKALKEILSPGAEALSFPKVANSLGMTEGNVRVAAYRLRARFATWLREEVAATIGDPDPSNVEDELRAIFVVLGG